MERNYWSTLIHTPEEVIERAKARGYTGIDDITEIRNWLANTHQIEIHEFEYAGPRGIIYSGCVILPDTTEIYPANYNETKEKSRCELLKIAIREII